MNKQGAAIDCIESNPRPSFIDYGLGIKLLGIFILSVNTIKTNNT